MRVDALYCIVAILCSGVGGCVAVSSSHTTGDVNDPGCVALAYAQALIKDDFREAARYVDEDSSRFLIRLANIRDASEIRDASMSVDYEVDNQMKGCTINIKDVAIKGEKASVWISKRKYLRTVDVPEPFELVKRNGAWIIVSGSERKTSTIVRVSCE